MHLIETIIPIFVIIFMGCAARHKGMITPEFLGPANRIAYYLAIPAMIFRSISKGSLKEDFHPDVLAVTVGTLLLFFILAWLACLAARIRPKQFGTFLQTCFHGNLGYIGLAVAYYFLGDQGLIRASILAGFVMIVQNFLAVLALQYWSAGIPAKNRMQSIVLKVLFNPVILSAMAGILFSLSGLPLPLVIAQCLDILDGLALPLSLLLIGASLSFDLMRSRMLLLLCSSMMKLILLPGLGFGLYHLLDISPQNFVPGLIVLASPSATITYVMAKEMNGDSEFAVAAISLSTLFSAVTFMLWLHLSL